MRAPSFIPEIRIGAPIQDRHDRLTQRDSPAVPEDGLSRWGPTLFTTKHSFQGVSFFSSSLLGRY